MKEKILSLIAEGMTYKQICNTLGCSKGTVAYHAIRAKKGKNFSLPGANNRYDWITVRAYYESGHSRLDCMERFGFCGATWTKAIERGDIVLRTKELLEVGQYKNRSGLRARLLKTREVPYECAKCGIGPEWNGEPLALVLDHINGVNDDNRLGNLRFLCPNCNSQMPTFAGRNVGKKHSGM